MKALPTIPPVDQAIREQMRSRVDQLTKPLGSLGRLEELAVDLAGMRASLTLSVEKKLVVTMAADHGVAEEGVSAYPSAVTAQMVLNFLRGGAAVNVFARQMGARVMVVDMGVASECPDHPNLVKRRIGPGTKNFFKEPAMTRDQAVQAVETGAAIAEEAWRSGVGLLALGEMGIGNTTSASAVVSVLSGAPVAEVVGRGTGVSDAVLALKLRVIEQSLARLQPRADDPWDVLSKVGGFEIGGLAGVAIGAAAHRVPVVVDGFIATAAALLAVSLSPSVKSYCFAGHQSVERGHRIALGALGLRPLLDLSMRLGEGTGAVLAMSVIESAVRMANEMATFDSAGVSQQSDKEEREDKEEKEEIHE